MLVLGGEVLVRGAGALARSLGMSPLLVGLTVVAFATSAPELAVSLQATLGGHPELAVGNVVGSNIANILFVLGASAVIAPIAVNLVVVRRDVPFVLGLSLLTVWLSHDLELSRLDGLILVIVMVAYTTFTVVNARREEAGEAAARASTATAVTPSRKSFAVNGVMIAAGVALLVLGATWLVKGATEVARAWGVSDLIIGLTVVAIGTSLPELATSIVAALRGQRDMAVGNIVGSCVFNLGAVLGICALLASKGIPIEPSAANFDMWVMVAAAAALLPVALTGLVVARWEGVLFVAYYAAYLTYLVLNAIEHPKLFAFSKAMTLFVIPITLVTLGVLAFGELRRRRERTGQTTAPV